MRLSRWMAPVLLLGCDTTTPAEYAQIVDEARACAPGDSCVLTTGGQCTCPMPVNATEQASVEEAAAEVECNGATAECRAHSNVRCEAGRCRSDESP